MARFPSPDASRSSTNTPRAHPAVRLLRPLPTAPLPPRPVCLSSATRDGLPPQPRARGSARARARSRDASHRRPRAKAATREEWNRRVAGLRSHVTGAHHAMRYCPPSNRTQRGCGGGRCRAGALVVVSLAWRGEGAGHAEEYFMSMTRTKKKITDINSRIL